MPLNDIGLDNCLKCSDCNSVCPVLAANAAYPGPKHLGPELERLRREGIAADSDWVEYCLGCHRCDVACPNQVNVSELIARAKAVHHKPFQRRLRDYWLSRPALLGRILSIAPWATNFFLGLKAVRLAMAAGMQITAERRFPPYSRPDLATPAKNGTGEPILFFPGCAIRYNQPDLGRKVNALLARAGFAPQVSDLGCCGVPALANGQTAEAHARAAANVDAMAALVAGGMRIVTACSSCGHMLKTGFGDILEDDPERAEKARRVAEATYDLAELLMARAEEGKLTLDPGQSGMRLAYHAPCHQISQGIGRPWYHLLRQIPGVSIEDLNAGCCGMSGTYGFKQEKYPVSMAVGQPLFAAIAESTPEMVVTECATCRMQIEHGAGVRTMHPAEILLEACGQPPTS